MPQLHRFYYNGPLLENTIISLDEGSAKHIWQVLRMQPDDHLIITDGKGSTSEGVIRIAERHQCDVTLGKVTIHQRPQNELHLVVGFTKNNSRNEWLLEKATELGVASIIPLIASRSEKVHFRPERWEKLIVSALLQSQRNYMPELSETMELSDVLKKFVPIPQRFVAHCMPNSPKSMLKDLAVPNSGAVLLIGPEGDFRADEVSLCVSYGFKPISLGLNRLRTETAAIAACAYFNLINDETD
jgi:16S rRNA (uracil1498-N3)-methyltransferase